MDNVRVGLGRRKQKGIAVGYFGFDIAVSEQPESTPVWLSD